MKRSILDKLAQDYHFSESAIALALDLTGSRPDGPAWFAFVLRLLNAAGVGALSAGAVFFVAANWQHYGVIGRFLILQTAFLICVGIAWWRAPPHPIGQAALILATLLIGALLALFGQSYQTGADVYELFFAWAALALPFALAGCSGAAWALWWCILNVALALYCGWLGQGDFIWLWLDRWGINRPVLLLLPCIVNLGAAGLFLYLGKSQNVNAAPLWLVRMLATFGFLYGTAASIAAVMTVGFWSSGNQSMTGQNLFVVAGFAAICTVIAVATLHSKKDVLPMALIAGSWIAISSAFLISHIKLYDIGGFFVIAMWLVATSTVASFILMKWVLSWHIDDETPEAPA